MLCTTFFRCAHRTVQIQHMYVCLGLSTKNCFSSWSKKNTFGEEFFAFYPLLYVNMYT